MKKLKTWFCCFLAALCTLLIGGCYYEYESKHADLYSVACKNLIAINGCIPLGEITDDPLIYELEKDEYGRVLFSYQEFDSVVHLLIMQKSENNLVYYYPEDCYLSFRTELSKYLFDFTQQDLLQILQTHLTEDDMTAFKALNDWNEPLQEEKCESTPITHNPPRRDRVDNGSVYEKVLLQYFEKEGKYIHPDNYNIGNLVTLWQKDAYGRKLIVISATIADYYDKREVRYSYTFVVIFNPDESYNLDTMTPLGDVSTFSQTVKQVKLLGNWNQPLD